MAGLYYEDFEEGQVFEHATGRTVSEMDNILFSTLTMNPQPLHLDAAFSEKTEFGQRLVDWLCRAERQDDAPTLYARIPVSEKGRPAVSPKRVRQLSGFDFLSYRIDGRYNR